MFNQERAFVWKMTFRLERGPPPRPDETNQHPEAVQRIAAANRAKFACREQPAAVRADASSAGNDLPSGIHVVRRIGQLTKRVRNIELTSAKKGVAL